MSRTGSGFDGTLDAKHLSAIARALYDVAFLIDVMYHVPPEAQRSFLDRVISKVKS